MEQLAEQPLPAPPPESAPEAEEAETSNWIVLPAVFLASALAVYFVSSLVPDTGEQGDGTAKDVAAVAPTVTAPAKPAPVSVTPVVKPANSAIKPPVVDAAVVPTSTPAVKAPTPPVKAAPKPAPPKAKPKRRGRKPRSTLTRRLLREANAAYKNLDCKTALPKYEKLIGSLSRSDPEYSPIIDRIKFCKRRTRR